jgi:hypothetical protein
MRRVGNGIVLAIVALSLKLVHRLLVALHAPVDDVLDVRVAVDEGVDLRPRKRIVNYF